MRVISSFSDGVGKSQGAQRTQRKWQLAVHSTSRAINLFHNPNPPGKKLKSFKKMRFFDITKKSRIVTNGANLLRFGIRHIRLYGPSIIPEPSRSCGHNSTRFLQRELLGGRK
ncbi:MAG: hypothetical protein C5S49_04815 [Candidatus Methanogaster sp.]|nr:MAG: hypothetical protein C5S49_04815 [ANME-2 cluster archaeon]